MLQPVAGHRDRVFRVVPAVDRDLHLLSKLLELVDRRRALQIGGYERRGFAFAAQEERELGGCSRLTRALEARKQDHRRRPTGERELRAAGAHERRQLVVDDLHDLLAGRKALRDVGAERPLLHLGDELLDDLEVDVGLEQRQANLAHRAGKILL